jgi:hypothetical protein
LRAASHDSDFWCRQNVEPIRRDVVMMNANKSCTFMTTYSPVKISNELEAAATEERKHVQFEMKKKKKTKKANCIQCTANFGRGKCVIVV